MLCSCLYIADTACDKFTPVTQANYNYNSGIPPLCVSSLERFRTRISPDFVSFCCEAGETKIKDQTVTPVLTSHSLLKLSNIRVYGDGITQEHTDNKNKVAIISEPLAIELFFTTDCLGRILTIDDTDYIVSGVYYYDNKTPLDVLSKDSAERIYIPYTCVENYSSREIQTIIYDNSARCAPLIEQICTKQYHLTNLYEKEKVINSLIHLLTLYVFIILCAVALYLRGAVMTKLTGEIRAHLKLHSFFNSLCSIPHKYLLLILAVIGVPVLMVLIFAKGDFSIFIVSKYIPKDNLFDIGSYIKSIADNAEYMNSLALTGDTYYPFIYSKVFNTIAILGAVTAGLFTGFVYSIIGGLRLVKIKILNN